MEAFKGVLSKSMGNWSGISIWNPEGAPCKIGSPGELLPRTPGASVRGWASHPRTLAAGGARVRGCEGARLARGTLASHPWCEGARVSLAPPHRVCHPDAMVLIAMVLISKTQCTVPVQMYCEKSCLESSCATIKETLSESFGNWSGYLWANFHMETLRNFFQNQSGICLDFLYEILKESLAK